MCNLIKCSIVSFMVGAVVGGIVVYKSKPIQKLMKKGENFANEKMQELKTDTAETMEDAADKLDETAKNLKKIK